MALNKRYSYTWHTGETGTAFTFPMRDSQGVGRTDVTSATFTLVDRDTGETVIDAVDCDVSEEGLLSYLPSAEDMATACRFLAQFTATTGDDDLIEPSPFYEGEIIESL